MGNLPRFICAPFSILACHGVIFGKVLLWGEKLGCEQRIEKAVKVPCSDKEDGSLTAAFFNLAMAWGFIGSYRGCEFKL